MTTTVLTDGATSTGTVSGTPGAVPELNPEHFTPRGLVIAQISQDAETFRDWLSRVRDFVIAERRESRSSYCSSGLDEFLQRHNLPGRGSSAPVPSQLIGYVPDHYSIAGLRKKRAEQQARFDGVKRDIRTDAVNAHVNGYSSEDRLRVFIDQFGFEPVTSRETWALNTESMSVAFPPGHPLATRDSAEFSRAFQRFLEEAVTTAGGSVVSRPRVYASYVGTRSS